MISHFKIAVLPGDGIGVDVTCEALRVLDAIEPLLEGVKFVFNEQAVGAAEYLRGGDPLPSTALDACAEADAVLLGAMGLPSVRWPDGKEMTPQIDLREKLDLYAGPRPIKLYHGDDTPLKGLGPCPMTASCCSSAESIRSKPTFVKKVPDLSTGNAPASSNPENPTITLPN